MIIECKQKSQQEMFEEWQVVMFGKVITTVMELDEYGPSGQGYDESDPRIKRIVIKEG